MKFIVNQPTKVLDLLVQKLKLSSVTKARNLLKEGSVQVDGEPVVKGDTVLTRGQTLTVKKADKSVRKIRTAPYEIKLNDDAVVVAVKPSGLLSVNRDGEHSQTFIGKLSAYLGERLNVVHRLDREVSGLMIFAKSPQVQKALEASWAENEKIYLALVEGAPRESEGTIESWLVENAALRVYSADNPEGARHLNARHAVTHYRVLKRGKTHSLVEVTLQTGRKHQIRVHLSELGCPIAGDKKYGARTDPYKRIALHATRFSFKHPVTGERLSFDSPSPFRAMI